MFENAIPKFINYRDYGGYMGITTIQLTNEMKAKISSFGVKGESYEKILQRMYDLAVKEHLREFLMSSDGTVTIDEARRELEKKWPRSK